jgi:hypothetical protein
VMCWCEHYGSSDSQGLVPFSQCLVLLVIAFKSDIILSSSVSGVWAPSISRIFRGYM